MNYSIDRAQVKANAKAQLGSNLFGKVWMMALVVILIQGAILTIAPSIPVVGSVATLVLTGPLSIGVSLVFLKLERGNSDIELSDIFVSFSNRFSKDFLLGLMISIFTFLWSLLFIIPGIIKAYSYSMSFYISLDHPDWDWKQCMEESKRITNGHKGELFVLDLSFIGWYLVGSLCCGIGTLWVTPYHMAAMANYYEALKGMNQAPVYEAPVAPQAPVVEAPVEEPQNPQG
ncbi:MAG: DUF975 family protein [Ruminococcaceae bacterium]|nr:DUF975 family protein [Oscillospiraceae bacterium]